MVTTSCILKRGKQRLAAYRLSPTRLQVGMNIPMNRGQGSVAMSASSCYEWAYDAPPACLCLSRIPDLGASSASRGESAPCRGSNKTLGRGVFATPPGVSRIAAESRETLVLALNWRDEHLRFECKKMPQCAVLKDPMSCYAVRCAADGVPSRIPRKSFFAKGVTCLRFIEGP